MIWLDPERVTLSGSPLAGVVSITVDRRASRFVEAYSDAGPHVVFADAPERRVGVRITRRVDQGGAGAHRPGDAAALAFRVGPSASDARVREVAVSVVIEAVENRVDRKGGATQVIACVAVSSDGASDPVIETPVAA